MHAAGADDPVVVMKLLWWQWSEGEKPTHNEEAVNWHSQEEHFLIV